MMMHTNVCLDSRIEVPAISCVREAIDILERFSLTKMPYLLSNVLNIRQEVGNYVIHHQQFVDQNLQQLHPTTQPSVHNLMPLPQNHTSNILMNDHLVN